ncbi:ABC-F family ATP-binding cassette domain-containing protein [Fusibacter bizertensis]|uniref:ABC-F family ATP-binding cassette domain-containing protein n=1 Tax=Fusibacter bizertensis TaxID=1488331 RepID=A0ABT6NB48_9FIRM|nr:ABC-F family ATP-binding cassette domain-containing protein [Fusibacter bizertensis]MDH8677637.1 ABC-F family ATP-binding cassette domain-containing protein [Fusibacter bizertensis]
MHLLNCNQISKSYSMTKLLDDIDFSIDSNDKIGLIGVNGTGKSTFLKIIVGLEFPDFGQVVTAKNIKINYLAQEHDYTEDLTVIEQLFHGNSEAMETIRKYEIAIQELEENPDDTELLSTFNHLSEVMNAKQLFDIEFQMKSILGALGIYDLEAKVQTLSGGQKKRVALAEALVTPCDLLVLDEPTNHLDSKTILWLENFLKARTGGLLMITHDRYFLDRIVNKSVELSRGKLYEYQGNYEYYLEKKAERMLQQTSSHQKNQNLYRRELAWMRAGVLARGTKSKSRIQRFEKIQEDIKQFNDSSVQIEAGFTRLGSKIAEIKNIVMQFGNKHLFDTFEYSLAPNDRIGIVGDNGVGKTTLLNIIAQRITPIKGTVEIGSTVKFGYFTQDFEGFGSDDQRAIEYIRDIAEYVTTPSGYRISASELMETFLFPADLQWTPIAKLSGGERRRLQLLGILIGAPNVLLLDEPTNNLDLDTLKVFEEYLDQFQGVILVVSHDRYFLDRTCDKLLAIDNGKLSFANQSYSEYLEDHIHDEAQEVNSKTPVKAKADIDTNQASDQELNRTKKEKLTFKELKLLETLPSNIDKLSDDLGLLDKEIERFSTDFSKLTQLTEKKEALELELLDLMEQYEALKEKESLIAAL